MRRAAAALAPLLWVLALHPGASWGHGGFRERLAAASRDIEAEPGNAQHYLARSALYRQHAEWARAWDDLERAARLAPDREDLDYFRGQLALEAGEPAAAAKILTRFLSAQPDHPAAHAALARALGDLDQPLEAARHFSLAIEHEPVPVPDHYLARARALLAAGRPAEALAGLDEGLETLGPVVSLALPAVEIEARRGHTDAALARLEQVARQSPRQEAWLARRAEILEGAGRRGSAREAWTRVLREIDGLPADRRATPAMAQLAAQARTSLDRLSAAGAAGE